MIIDEVHDGVLHDGLDSLFLGKLHQFPLGSWIGEGFGRDGEEELVWMSWMVSVLTKTVLMEVEMMGSTQVMVLEGTDP